MPPLLSVRGLSIDLDGHRLVDSVDFDVAAGEILGIVGESGSGKSLTLRALTRLLPLDFAVGGQVLWQGIDLGGLSQRTLNAIRGRQIAMIFQEPMSALNPLLSVGVQITESLRAHLGLRGAAARSRAVELLDLVGIVEPARRLNDLPHEFSGGMRQRAMIAIALAAEPRLLLADEPTTALDVTVQNQVLQLLMRLRRELSMSIVLVTHDLGVVARTCDRVGVFYAGRIVETGPTAEVLRFPRHAYTLGLRRAMPDRTPSRRRLVSIPGLPPLPGAMPPGCRFAPRCALAQPACIESEPVLRAVTNRRRTACRRADAVLNEGTVP